MDTSTSEIQLPGENLRGAKRHVVAWLVLCAALAVHVTDEALTDFLSVYNPYAEAIRRRLRFLPVPTFSFRTWLVGLILAVIILLLLALVVYRGAWWTRPLSYVFGVAMLFNGLLHISGSVYLRRLMPGTYSAPILLGASIYLLICTKQRRSGKS